MGECKRQQLGVFENCYTTHAAFWRVDTINPIFLSYYTVLLLASLAWYDRIINDEETKTTCKHECDQNCMFSLVMRPTYHASHSWEDTPHARTSGHLQPHVEQNLVCEGVTMAPFGHGSFWHGGLNTAREVWQEA